ncbi:MAG: hypothetical protein ABIM77_00800 [candidate division WOR-3 bacterium]
MKKLIAILILFNFIACYAVRYVAPPQKEVKLMSEVETGKVKLTKRVWYAVWGLVPITDNSTEDLIQKYNLKNVKAKSYLSFLDYIISAFTGYFTIVTLTLEVEGEPAE